ncbi:MAG: hypothetical protein ACE5KT_00930 [Methanosarcinales archaeon]
MAKSTVSEQEIKFKVIKVNKMPEAVEEKIRKWKLEIKEIEEKLPKLKDSVEISSAIGRIGSLEDFIWFEKEKERLKQKFHQVKKGRN